MIDAWWVVLAGGICFLAGIAVTLVAAAFLASAPLDGARYTGDLPEQLRDDQ